MTVAEPEDTGAPALSASPLEALGDANWRTRQVAVKRLAKETSPSLIQQLVEIVRDEHRNLSRLNAAIQVLTRTECDVVPALLPLLTTPDADSRAYVALTLGERGDVRAIAGLIAALADPDTNVRVHAIEALGKLQAAAAVDVLIQFVEQLDFELAFPAIDALIAIGDERIAHRLFRLLQNPLLKTAAVEALGALGDQEAIVPLLKLLGDSTVAPGTIAIAVQQIHDRYAIKYGSGQTIAEIVRQGAMPGSVAVFRSSLSVSTTTEAAAVVSALGWLPGDEAEATLLDLLDNPNLCGASLNSLAARGAEIIPRAMGRFERSSRGSQLRLIELYGRIGDRRAVPLLSECFDKEDEERVIKSLDALARIGDDRMYSSAKPFFGHSSLRVRQAAVNAVNSLGHPDTCGDMQQLLRDRDPHVCESALKVATYFGFPECIDLVLACCDHPDEQVRRTAVEHLPCLDDERIGSRLQRALESDCAALRAAAAGALGEIDAASAIELLPSALDDHNVWVRYFAVRSLSRSDCPDEIRAKFLSLALSDPAMQVRIAAVEALKTDAMLALTALAGGNEDDLAIAALKALGATHSIAALPTLQLALSSNDPYKQTQAIEALGELGLPDATEPLRHVALGRDQPLAEKAIEALGRVPQPESIAALLEVINVPIKRAAATAALVKLGDLAVSMLACHLHGLGLDVRRAIIEVLLRIRSCAAIEVLETALADAEPAVRFSALAALAHVRRPARQISDAVGSEGDA